MNEQELVEKLLDMLEHMAWMNTEDRYETGFDQEGWLENSQSEDFNSAGLVTSNVGIVLKLQSGEEFQLTVVRSNHDKW